MKEPAEGGLPLRPAVERWADPDLIAAYHQAKSNLPAEGVPRRVRSMSVRFDDESWREKLLRQHQANVHQEKFDSYNTAWRALYADTLARLARGELVAFGLIAGQGTLSRQRELVPAEWWRSGYLGS